MRPRRQADEHHDGAGGGEDNRREGGQADTVDEGLAGDSGQGMAAEPATWWAVARVWPTG